MKKSRSKLVVLAALAASALTLAGCAPAETPSTPTGPVDGDLAALIEAAKAEGSLTYFNDFPPAINDRIAAEFQAEYGITIEYLALNSALLIERFAAEADAGALSADVTSMAQTADFFVEAIDKGWAIPIQEAGIPALEDGSYPEEFLQEDVSATVGIFPFLILYNENSLDSAMVPASFEDLTDPKYKDQIVIVDPATNNAFVGFYDVLRESYGEEWFQGVLANNPKFYPAASAGAQAMMAGEGLVMTPAAHAVAQALRDSGAPVGTVLPPITTGPQFNLLMTNPETAQHPNAAKLFANWMLTKESNIHALGDLAYSPFDTERLPSGFAVMPTVTDQMRTNIMQLLKLG